MTTRIYIIDIHKDYLPYHDRRSIRRWCRNNGVRIFNDTGSRLQFVMKDEFEKALGNKYSESPEIVRKRRNIFSERKASVDGITGNYKPQGAIESRFLSILQNLT